MDSISESFNALSSLGNSIRFISLAPEIIPKPTFPNSNSSSSLSQISMAFMALTMVLYSLAYQNRNLFVATHR